MSAQVWLAAALLLLGGVVGALGTAGLARANPTETIPYSGNQGWRRYVVFHVVEVITVCSGVVLLYGEVPSWGAFTALLVALVPQIIVSVVHQHQVRRHRASR